MAEFSHSMSHYRCMFNMPIGTDKLMLIRDGHQHGGDYEDEYDFDYSNLRKANLMTWVSFKLGNLDEATQWSDMAVELGQGKDLMCLEQRAIVFHEIGVDRVVLECKNQLNEMCKQPERWKQIAESKAQQAYALRKLMEREHVQASIKILQELLSRDADRIPQWKYSLALSYKSSMKFIKFDHKQELAQLRDKLIDMLKSIIETSTDERLKSYAYAQMALTKAHLKCYTEKEINGYCEKALLHEGSNSEILRLCGTAAKTFNLDQAIRHLEKSRELNDGNMLTYHQLGKCYIKKAEQSGPRSSKVFRQSPYIEKAFDCLSKSIKLSHSTNDLASLDLGLLYFHCGKFQEALDHSRQIVKSYFSQSFPCNIQGRCYLALYKITNDEADRRKAIEAFTKSISFQFFKYSSIDLKDYNNSVPQLERVYGIEYLRPTQRLSSRRSGLLQLVQDPDGFLVVVRDTEEGTCDYFSDLDVNIASLKQCLRDERFETALLLYRIIAKKATSPLPSNIVLQVLSQTAEWRLKNDTPYAKLLFQEVFHMKYNHSSRIRQGRTLQVSKVLILCQQSQNDKGHLKAHGRLAMWLQNIFVKVYGLYVDMKWITDVPAEVRPRQVSSYRLLVLLLGPQKEQRADFLDQVASYLRNLSQERDEQEARVRVIKTHGQQTVPDRLSQYDQFDLPDLQDLGLGVDEPATSGATLTGSDLLLPRNLDSLSRLFEFLTNSF